MKWLKQKLDISKFDFYTLGENALLVSNEKIAWSRVSQKIADLIKSMDGCTLQDIYVRIKNSGLMEQGDALALLKKLSGKDIEGNIYNYRVKKIFFLVTKRCNLNCLTCYVNATGDKAEDEMSLTEIESVFGKLKKEGFKSITISGGEPLLRKDIKDIAKLAAANFDTVSINTNGTLVTRELVEFFKENRIHVMIGLEGVENEINDKIRGKGTLLKIIEAIKHFKEAGHKDVSVSMTVTNLNKSNITQVYDLCIKFGIPVNYGIFVETGRGLCNGSVLRMTPESMVTSFIDELECEIHNQNPTTTIPDFLTKCSTYCGAIYSIVNIMANGDIYPCPNLIDERWKMGNIKEQELNDIINNSPVTGEITCRDVRTVKGCKDCAVRFVCAGGCMANAYFRSGDINDLDPLCMFYKTIFTSYLKNWSLERTDTDNVTEVIKDCREKVSLR